MDQKSMAKIKYIPPMNQYLLVTTGSKISGQDRNLQDLILSARSCLNGRDQPTRSGTRALISAAQIEINDLAIAFYLLPRPGNN
jgi:hypothetical protein